MPEITALGWFHTGIAIIALLAGLYSLVKYKFIKPANRSAQIYLLCTFLAAASSLMIFNQGGFGPAHILGILTLLALFGGFAVKKIPLFAPVADYLEALCFSATFLFHMIPAITDTMLRLPVGDPFATTIEDPRIFAFYILFVVLFVIGFAAQCLILRKRGSLAA